MANSVDYKGLVDSKYIQYMFLLLWLLKALLKILGIQACYIFIYSKLDIFTMIFLGMCISWCYLMAVAMLITRVVIATRLPGVQVFRVFTATFTLRA